MSFSNDTYLKNCNLEVMNIIRSYSHSYKIDELQILFFIINNMPEKWTQFIQQNLNGGGGGSGGGTKKVNKQVRQKNLFDSYNAMLDDMIEENESASGNNSDRKFKKPKKPKNSKSSKSNKSIHSRNISNSRNGKGKMSDAEYIRQFSMNALQSSSESSQFDSSSCTTATSYSSLGEISD